MKFRLPWLRASETKGNPTAGEIDTKGVLFTPQTAAVEFPFGAPRAPGTNVDYATEVKNGLYSSVITSALCWVMRTFPEAPVIVQQRVEKRWEEVDQHDLTKLLRRPNPEYGGKVLWMCTAMDFCYGEAFWLKVRNGNGEVVELWWIPRTMITPIPDYATGRLDYYRYHPGFTVSEDLDPKDVVHFRFGKDPRALLRGFSPLAAVMREVYIDDQAGTFTAAILKNLGIIGVIFAPETGTIPTEQAKNLKDYVQQGFTGDNRAKAMMFTAPMKATLLQYNLQGFDVGPIRDIVEERVSAALAIPAAVIGFGTGLQQTKVGATMREMVKLAWQGGIEPNQAIMADELDRSLLSEFHVYGQHDRRCHFDTSEVEALSESPAEKADRVIKLVETNIIKVMQAQRELGYPPDSTQDKYLRELTPAGTGKLPLPLPRNRLVADANAPANNAPVPGDANAPAEKSADEVIETAGANGNGTHHVTVEGSTINVAPTPVNLAFTIESPRAGTKRSGTMEKIDGKTVFTMTEAPDELPAGSSNGNGDSAHDE